MKSFLARVCDALTSSNSSPKSPEKVRARRLNFEPLECRELLAVTLGEIQATYPDLKFDPSENYNIIEIKADELSESKLREKIAEAKKTTGNDIIVCPTDVYDTIFLKDGLSINVDSPNYGSITIIGWGTKKLTIDASSKKATVLTIEGHNPNVSLAGLTITGGQGATSSSSPDPVGGGIHIYQVGATLLITDCIVTGNNAVTGGGIYNSGGTVTITNCDITNNTANLSGGGGIYNETNGKSGGVLTIVNSSVSGNKVAEIYAPPGHAEPRASGGGIFNFGTLTVVNCLISGNSAATGNGGGICTGAISTLTNPRPATITNSTIVGNVAYVGGGVYNGSPISVDQSENGDRELILNNTIVAHNKSLKEGISPDVTTSYAKMTAGYNLIGVSVDNANDKVSNNVNGNKVGTAASPLNPEFVSFTPYSSWSADLWKGWDLQLTKDSPAVDKGHNTLAVDAAKNPLMVDLLGNHRIANGGYSLTVDIGAYEYGSTRPVPKAPDLEAFDGGTVTPNPIIKGNTFSVTTGTIKNVGNAVSSGYTVTFYALSSVPEDYLEVTQGIRLDSTDKTSLGIDGTTTATLLNVSTVPLTAGTSYYIAWFITGGGDTTPGNNWAYCTAPVLVENPIPVVPDLEASKGGTVTPNPIIKGNTFSVTTGTIKNIGNATSSGYTVTFYALSSVPTSQTQVTGGTPIGSVNKTTGLSIYDTTTATLNGTMSLNAGTYYIAWNITGVNGETNFTNNWAYYSTEVGVAIPVSVENPIPVVPDLAASKGGKVSSNPITKGDIFSIETGTIQNIGNAASSGYTVTFYALSSVPTSQTDVINGTPIGSVNKTTGLSIYDTTTATLNGTMSLNAGTYYIAWNITGVNGETNFTNNWAYYSTEVGVAIPVSVENPIPTAITSIFAVAPDAGPFSQPIVLVYDAVTEELLHTIFVDQYGVDYTGGLRLATGDLDGDGIPDIVVVPGRLAAPHVLVYSGATGELLEDYCIPAHATYGNSFKDGLNVAVGDVTGNGWNDIVLVPGNGQAVVMVFENIGGGLSNQPVREFNAFEDDKGYIGGGSIAVGNTETAVDSGGPSQIVIGTGPGVAPIVRIFDVAEEQPTYTAIREIKSIRPEAVGGVNVALGDLTGNGFNDLILSSKNGGRSWVDIYQFYPEAGIQHVTSFQAFGPDEGNNVAVNITVLDTDGDGLAEILATQGAKGKAGTIVRKFQLDAELIPQIIDNILGDWENDPASGMYIG